MSDHPRSGQPLGADDVLAQAAALAAHLERSGVHWLPKANAEATARLAGSMCATATPAQTSADTTDTNGSTQSDAAITADRSAEPPSHRPEAIRPATRVQSVAAFASEQGRYPGDPIAPPDRAAALKAIQDEVAVCTRCAVLSNCRNKTVFGEGSVTPRVAFFGEGPGADEDRTGRPFVGKAGQLLTKMIEACRFKREQVYILNTVKCRPPANRNPEPDEIENCRPYYQRQLAILRPEYIVCLGAVSAQELLHSKLSVGRLRGKLHQHFESKVLVTYHPAYLLRNPAAKKAAWADLQLMLRDAGIEV